MKLEAEIKAELEPESTQTTCGLLGQCLANVCSTSQSSVLCQAAAGCGTPQLMQQLVDLKDLISHYRLPADKLVDPELLSNVLDELGSMNLSLVRNLKVTQS